MFLSENGFSRIGDIKTADSVYGFDKTHFSKQQLLARVDFVCECFKNQLDKTSKIVSSGFKKKKTDKIVVGSTDILKRKVKNNVQKDDVGNIIYPIVISSSLKLVSPGSTLFLTKPK